MQDQRTIYLVGFMAAGKTAVGTELARQLGWKFRDTDELVVQREGRSIEEIFRSSGEARFRAVEWEVLQSSASPRRCVVACGGGVFLRHSRRRWLQRHGRTVWLDVPLELASARAEGPGSSGSGRPLWPGGDAVARRALFDRRRAGYALARFRVDGSSGTPAEIAGRIRRALK